MNLITRIVRMVRRRGRREEALLSALRDPRFIAWSVRPLFEAKQADHVGPLGQV